MSTVDKPRYTVRAHPLVAFLASLVRARSGPFPTWLVTIVVVVGAYIAGTWAALGGTHGLLALAGPVVVIVGLLVVPLVHRRIGSSLVVVELPMLFVLLSGLVFRERDAASLSSNPLDAAGLYRLLCLGTALTLGALALTHPEARGGHLNLTRPFRLYAAYAATVFFGALVSVDVQLTLFREFELITLVIVVAGALRTFGPEAIRRGLRVMYLWYVAMALLVWAGVLFLPSQGLIHLTRSPLPIQIEGAVPAISSNGTGTIGTILAIWSLALLLSRSEEPIVRRTWTWAVMGLGLATLVFAQYRTGYVAVLLAVIVLLALRRRGAIAAIAVVAVVVATLWGAAIVRDVAPVALRGADVTEASQLSSRVEWWSASIPIWQESPIVGRGLLTATRFEVLEQLGRTTTSSIHGTWVEALVGTGLVGVVLLGLALIIVLVRAGKEAVTRGRLTPIALAVVLLIRSITGPTFESLSDMALLFVLVACSLPDPIPVSEEVPAPSLAGVVGA
jgi:O-antigen ligase